MFTPDLILPNGQGVGPVGSHNLTAMLLNSGMDPGILRPWIGKDGGSYVALSEGFDKYGREKNSRTFRLAANAATLKKEEWVYFDDVLVREARPVLRVVSRLVQDGLVFNLPDAMANPVIQRQTMTDFGDASLSMYGIQKSRRDRPHFALYSYPTPIVSSDWGFPVREVLASRKGGLPLDENSIAEGTKRCAELLERLFLGTYDSAGYTFNSDLAPNSTSLPIYGLTNHPSRITATMTLPTAAGWVPETFINEMLSMLAALQAVFFNGPYGVLYSPSWTKYMGGDYSAAYPGLTLRKRFDQIDDITSVDKVDFLTGFQIIIYQKSQSTIRVINGLPLRNLQWASEDGFFINGKIYGIQLPELRTNGSGNLGVAHGVAA